MPQSWDTRDRPASERYDFWRETLTTAFTPLTPQSLDGHGWYPGDAIHGRVACDSVDILNVASIHSIPQRHLHGTREVRESGEEVLFVNLILAGRCIGMQDDRQCDLGVGSLGLFDARRSFTLNYTTDWQAVSVRVPAHDATALLGDHAPTALAIETGAGAGGMLGKLMVEMADRCATYDPSTHDTLAEAFLLLLQSALPGNTQSHLPRTAEIDGMLRERILDHARSAVRRGPVRAEEVAQMLHISVRKLHQLFENGELSFGGLVLAARVEGCAQELAAGAPDALTDLSARWGFADVSHMHRAFRRTLGCSPSAYRRQYADSRSPRVHA